MLNMLPLFGCYGAREEQSDEDEDKGNSGGEEEFDTDRGTIEKVKEGHTPGNTLGGPGEKRRSSMQI